MSGEDTSSPDENSYTEVPAPSRIHNNLSGNDGVPVKTIDTAKKIKMIVNERLIQNTEAVSSLLFPNPNPRLKPINTAKNIKPRFAVQLVVYKYKAARYINARLRKSSR
jgi:hypothetical protein